MSKKSSLDRLAAHSCGCGRQAEVVAADRTSIGPCWAQDPMRERELDSGPCMAVPDYSYCRSLQTGSDRRKSCMQARMAESEKMCKESAAAEAPASC